LLKRGEAFLGDSFFLSEILYLLGDVLKLLFHSIDDALHFLVDQENFVEAFEFFG
jgi:hypothetical protein